MTRLLATLLLSLSVACSVDPDAFSVQGGQEYEAAFETASQAWCEATDGTCCPHQDQEGESSAAPVTEDLLTQIRGEPGAVGYITYGPDHTSQIYVDDSLHGEELVLILAHELGHHCGCGDTREPGRAMSFRLNLMADVTAEDAACAR